MPASKKYRVLVGINYPDKKGGPEIRREPGDEVNDLPADSVDWLLERKCVEPVKTSTKKAKKGDEES